MHLAGSVAEKHRYPLRCRSTKRSPATSAVAANANDPPIGWASLTPADITKSLLLPHLDLCHPQDEECAHAADKQQMIAANRPRQAGLFERSVRAAAESNRVRDRPYQRQCDQDASERG